MSGVPPKLAFVRQVEAPQLPAPPSESGIQGWLIKNLFSSPVNSLLTVVFGVFTIWFAWGILDWMVVRAAWTGVDREACLFENAGACWPVVVAKFPQWIYGFFPIEERWRVNTCFIVGAAALIPMMMPSVPHKFWNALFLLVAYPLMTLILLTGGHFGIGLGTYATVGCILLLAAAALSVAALGVEEAVSHNRAGLGLAVAALAAWLLSFMVNIPPLVIAGLSLAAGVLSLVAALRAGGRSFVLAWAVLSAGILAAMLTLDIDFGLVPVETPQWGGLTVTLIVAITGMVASLPLGILLALGRRSQMPVVRMFSVIFIELWRGVPLITVLFMSSVMLPLFLPEGTNFDKLLRALIGVALFTSAYMAEAIRGGLQAIPKGQYEGAMALGLSYWQMTIKIILPQALKISIPNIVSNFIGLFKDTTLVSIVGIFDLLGIVRAGLKETIWASPSSTPTAYFALALMFWIFCFGMSRYSMFTERRLHTGHKR